jgi:uncharacterized protein (DUF2147 family)
LQYYIIKRITIFTFHNFIKMKKSIVFFIMLFLTSFNFAQIIESSIIGVWKTEEAKIQIYKTTSGHYAGKIIWLDEPINPKTNLPKVDENNPKTELKTKPIIGLIMITGMMYNSEEKIWEGGKIYDPRNGKTYSSKITLKNNNTLSARGFVGLSILGRTVTWKRVLE